MVQGLSLAFQTDWSADPPQFLSCDLEHTISSLRPSEHPLYGTAHTARQVSCEDCRHAGCKAPHRRTPWAVLGTYPHRQTRCGHQGLGPLGQGHFRHHREVSLAKQSSVTISFPHTGLDSRRVTGRGIYRFISRRPRASSPLPSSRLLVVCLNLRLPELGRCFWLRQLEQVPDTGSPSQHKPLSSEGNAQDLQIDHRAARP